MNKKNCSIRDFITASNKASRQLESMGYRLQGWSPSNNIVSVVKVENENTGNEKKRWTYGKNYIEILEKVKNKK